VGFIPTGRRTSAKSKKGGPTQDCVTFLSSALCRHQTNRSIVMTIYTSICANNW
jgi:hypothetical protein